MEYQIIFHKLDEAVQDQQQKLNTNQLGEQKLEEMSRISELTRLSMTLREPPRTTYTTT